MKHRHLYDAAFTQSSWSVCPAPILWLGQWDNVAAETLRVVLRSTPAQPFKPQRGARNAPGVVNDFRALRGTGAGKHAQDLTELRFFGATMAKPVLTTSEFDSLTGGSTEKSPRIIWTLPAIARRLGTGVDFVRDTLAKVEGSPVKMIGNRYYAVEDELIAFLRR